MSLVLLYSCAFLFVKIYAEKSILSNSEPSDTSLYEPETEEHIISAEPTVTQPTEKISVPESSEPVEYIVNKPVAGQYKMLMAEATSVPDTIQPSVTTTPSVVTTAPTTTEAPATTTEKKTEKTTVSTTEPPEPTSVQQSKEEIIEEEDDEETAQEEIVEVPEPDEFIELTPDELAALLESLGITNLSPASPAPSNPGDILYSGNSYKNQTVTIYDSTKGRLRTDNAFDLVCEITNYEVGGTMEPEAIKAQAVAVYTYIKYYEQKGEYADIGTKSNVPSLIVECVEAVDGLAMYYDGEYIMSAFSASTGGYSAASKNVWGGDLPYLQSVQNDFDYLDEKNFGRVTTYTVEEVREKIESKTDIKLSNNYSEWIKILSYNDNIYAGQLSIDGHTSAYIKGKERTITGHIFRTYVLNIRSTAFNVSYSNGVFTFITYGYGHGVGMSQVGANLYAKYGGYTFDQILHHYYTGITIK